MLPEPSTSISSKRQSIAASSGAAAPPPPPPPPGRRTGNPPQVAVDRMRVDQVSDDVKVVEEFSDASDDELARLIADLRNEMKN